MGELTLASGGLECGLGRRSRRAGLPLAGARAAAVRGPGALIQLPEAGPAAALLLATVLAHSVVVAAVVTEDTAAYPGDDTGMGCKDATQGSRAPCSAPDWALGWALGATRLITPSSAPTLDHGLKAHLLRLQESLLGDT